MRREHCDDIIIDMTAPSVPKCGIKSRLRITFIKAAQDTPINIIFDFLKYIITEFSRAANKNIRLEIDMSEI